MWYIHFILFLKKKNYECLNIKLTKPEKNGSQIKLQEQSESADLRQGKSTPTKFRASFP